MITTATILKAEAFATWVERTIGSRPRIVEKIATLPTGEEHEYIDIVFSPEQRQQLIRWLDDQLGGALQTDRPPQDIQINLGGVLLPWSMRYLLPAGVGLFGLGWIGRGVIRR